jgi:hypothetical protein
VTRTGQAAADYATGRVGDYYPPPGYCLKFTRECFDVPSYYASAIDAWNGAPDKHPGDRYPPLGVPVFFQSASVYDHVAVHVGGGQVVTTFNDEIRQMSLGSMESSFGPYLGWTGSLNTVTVYTATDTGGDDFLSHLSYEEQRRVLLAADSWIGLSPSIKENTDRLPHIHFQADNIFASCTNITNGVFELLDALHAVQGRHARGDRFSWPGLVAVILAVFVGIAWTLGFVVSIVNPDQLTPSVVTGLQIVGGVLVGALATWIVSRRTFTIPEGKHRMHEPPAPIEPYTPPVRDVSADPNLNLATHPQDGP